MLTWAKKTSWGWWETWDDTALQTHDSNLGGLRPNTPPPSHGCYHAQHWIPTSERGRNFFWFEKRANIMTPVSAPHLKLACLCTTPVGLQTTSKWLQHKWYRLRLDNCDSFCMVQTIKMEPVHKETNHKVNKLRTLWTSASSSSARLPSTGEHG